MIIFGAARIPLRVGDRSVNSEILITPDLNGLIIGIDWREKQGQFIDTSETDKSSSTMTTGLTFRRKNHHEESVKYT